jgi:hypothetical protein
MKELLKSPRLAAESSQIEVRRGFLGKAVASLAAYCTSLFVTNPAHATECYEMCNDAYQPLGENWCFQLTDECTIPLFGIHNYQYTFYYATEWIGTYHCCYANPSQPLGTSCDDVDWGCY